MGFKISKAQETIQYTVEPAILAEAVQDTLRRIGSVQRVSRETGIIEGKVSEGFLMAAPKIQIRITRTGEFTELSVQTHRDEGLATSGGAEKGMVTFLKRLGEDPRLSEKASGGW